MQALIFRNLAALRQNYWFWPSALTALAVVLGFAVPALDRAFGPASLQWIPLIAPIGVDGARAILTTLAGATLGVAGVAFSITIVAVTFASANYGPRLIGNFMGDRVNQVVLGILVATFVYCITVLAAVHAATEVDGSDIAAFVPLLSIAVSLLLTLLSVGALIFYIHHIPESINIMNLVARIGGKLEASIVRTLDEEAARRREHMEVDVSAWNIGPDGGGTIVRAATAGYLQQIDIAGLEAYAGEHQRRIEIHRSTGDFLAKAEPILTVRPEVDEAARAELERRLTQGSNRTDVQDVLFLSDQLVEVLARALSPGVNDPPTAILCLDWLRSGLSAFAARQPWQPAGADGPVLYRRVTFEHMLNQSFGDMRQYVAADRTVTLHSIGVLTDLAIVATTRDMVAAVTAQLDALARSAGELLAESTARSEVESAAAAARRTIATRHDQPIGAGSAQSPPSSAPTSSAPTS